VDSRRLLLEVFDAALQAVDGRACVARFLRAADLSTPIEVFAIGKAASAMTLGACDALGERVAGAFVVTKDDHVDPWLRTDSRISVHEAAHPVPDARSLDAGAALVARIAKLAPSTYPLFLVSGGASSLIEHLRAGVTLDDLRALNRRGLAAGWDIGRLNAERAALSMLKGGGVAALLAGRAATALFISDVPGDSPQIIGSGLLGGHMRTADAIDRVIVANVDVAVRAAVEAAAIRGLTLATAGHRFDGDAAQVGASFVDALRECPADGLVWGGESTVTLPGSPGRGGRNTHLALAAARRLRANDRLTILAAGTDGTDGPTEDAGAIVDAGTLERAELGGCDVERAWRAFDSGTALEAAGDLVHTGPTGTNVGDLLIGLRAPRRWP
jgi:glycerate 2-kinase